MSLKVSSMFLIDKAILWRAICKLFISIVAMAFTAEIMPYGRK